MISKKRLQENVDTRVSDFHDILQEISDTLNKGQRKQILKNEKIKKAFDLFKVEYEV
ncbi:MAG: hypothetical protein II698_03780 [Ruminococcus sp.]|nr:hypothetical protein [Ruminococcus sp.]